MYIINNGTIQFTGIIPAAAKEALEDFCDERMGFELNEEKTASVFVIDEAYGDISDGLNAIVEILEPYGIKPLPGEHNRYYGDYDGYDVFTGERFESFDDEEYGAYLNEQSYKDMVAAAKDLIKYCKRTKKELPARLMELVNQLDSAMKKGS